MLELIKLSLWNTGDAKADECVYEEMKKHTILALPAPVFSKIVLPAELKSRWKADILDHITRYANYEYIQSKLPLTVPYVILKGTAAAKYYPYPEYRTMGDIDIMTSREDFECAYRSLLADGFSILEESEREIVFEKDGIVIELHRFFASLNNPEQSKYLDDLILANINPSHVLPDPVNGLVLLEHISQHMEHGLGLRQIIDWMMFVNRELDDELWSNAFERATIETGLNQVAIVSTKMCQQYLGLSENIHWCKDADSELCAELMESLLSSGNFDRKRGKGSAVESVTSNIARKGLFRYLQTAGEYNWEAYHRHHWLKPFAWLYQIGRYAKKGFQTKRSGAQLKEDIERGRNRKELLKKLRIG